MWQVDGLHVMCWLGCWVLGFIYLLVYIIISHFITTSLIMSSTEVVEDIESIPNVEEVPPVEAPTQKNKRYRLSVDGMDDPFKPREGRDLVWKDVNMTLAAHKDQKEKKILDGVWGEVPKRQITAIMGPSGSGKTSLLNILAGRAATNGKLTIEADVRLNNYAVDPTNMEVRQKIAFVAQDDSLQVTATPREAIKFSAKLRLPASLTDEQLDRLTEAMLDELGLTAAADTIVGGALVKGISGGERKRTSVGVELVSRPALVFLDEPTSGLDSFNAVKLCQVLKKVANAGSSVLFTIHQPSSEIFNALDRLILLNKGRVMFQGLIREVGPFFEHCGHPTPPDYNPADHIMNVALSHSIEKLEQDGFFPNDERKLGESFLPDDAESRDALGITGRSKLKEIGPSPGFAAQTRLLLQRELLNLKRSPTAMKSRTGMTLGISFIVGFLFFQIGDSDFSDFINVQSTFGALLMAVMANVFSTALPSLVSFPSERPVFLREYSTNHYSVASYFTSRLVIEMLVTAFQVSLSTMITYLLCSFTMSFGLYWSALYIMALASTALGVFVGCLAEDATSAIEYLPMIFLPQILFAGFLVPPDLMPVWLSWLRWIFPLTYGTLIVVGQELGDGRCDDIEGKNNCEAVAGNIDADPSDTWWYYLVLILIFVVVRTGALVALKRKTSKFY